MRLREAAEQEGVRRLNNLRAALAEPDDEEFDVPPLPKPERIDGQIVRTVNQPPFGIDAEPDEMAEAVRLLEGVLSQHPGYVQIRSFLKRQER